MATSVDFDFGTATDFPENLTNLTLTVPECDHSYVPTVEEYKIALGGYGIALLTVGGLVTFALYFLFVEQMWFTFNNSHKMFRRHLYWLISIYPFMALMSTVSCAVPRAFGVCSAVKVTYMCIGIGHFADLTILMFGSERVMVWTTKGSNINLQVLPLCCCCRCLPHLPVSKERIRLVKWLLWQMKWSQSIYYLLVLILQRAHEETDGDHKALFLFLNVLSLISFLSGVYALSILSPLAAGYLQKYNYFKKSMMLKLLIIITKFQGFVFDFLGDYEIACMSEYMNTRTLMQTIDNSMYIVETLIFGIFSYMLYHNVEFNEPTSPDIPGHPSRNSAIIVTGSQSKLEENGKQEEDPFQEDSEKGSP